MSRLSESLANLSIAIIDHGGVDPRKNNDQVRFELAFDTINPSIKVLAPWRLPEFYQRFQGRNDLLDYAAEKGIPVTSTKAKPYSIPLRRLASSLSTLSASRRQEHIARVFLEKCRRWHRRQYGAQQAEAGIKF
ncbi:argininosuccinate synthase [Colletotrichum tabaci]|uniref:Argininosuccinate synthase n=1 Tax=Colletotrichum tabaci TaxID=1209068 RepID=A0AAV9T9S2_9PEZI